MLALLLQAPNIEAPETSHLFWFLVAFLVFVLYFSWVRISTRKW